ncbi:hypothetical protein BpHYR1_047634 [Brachionus plicatilis]|uniref:Uncharacterized protein n=1 Tax=Brachionus plicatilis TaxID=10195 RepID=A0A3M7PGY9_BRAPC|nr:hypothetical protein BpHYR1_047634 [Brachionus plicatilis]
MLHILYNISNKKNHEFSLKLIIQMKQILIKIFVQVITLMQGLGSKKNSWLISMIISQFFFSIKPYWWQHPKPELSAKNVDFFLSKLNQIFDNF